MQTAVARFLQYLRVERNASDLTVKSYREDLEALVEYLTDVQGRVPGAGRGGHGRAARLRGRLARGRLRQDHDRPAPGLAAQFLPLRPARGLDEDNPAKPLRNPRKPRSLPHFLSADDIGRLLATPPADDPHGPARPGDPGNAVFGRAARQRSGGPERRRPGLGRRHVARARQGTPRAPLAGRLVRHPGRASLAGRAAALCRARNRAPTRRCSPTSSAAG